MATARPGYFWDGAEWAPIGVAPAGSNVTDHGQLTGRDNPDQHSIDSVTDLTGELAGKAPVGHTHAEQTYVAGDGIEIVPVGDLSTVSNTDQGSDAVAGHVGQGDPHPGIYAEETHTHPYAPDPHDHDYSPTTHAHDLLYEPLGQSALVVSQHDDQDAHTGLAAQQVAAGDGINLRVDGVTGLVTIDNTAQNGQPLVAAALQQTTPQTIPNNAFTTLTGLTVSEDSTGELVTAATPNGFTAPRNGVYLITGAIGFVANATGQRALRVLVNGVEPVGGTVRVPAPTAGVSNLGWSGQLSLNVGDVVTFQGYQDSGAGRATENASTRMTISMVNGAVSQAVVGMGYAQLTGRNVPDSEWRAVQVDKQILATLGATNGATVATAGYTLQPGDPEGWYDVYAALSFPGNATGRRVVRVTVNADPLLAPLVPQGYVPVALAGSTAFIQTSGAVYLKPGDRIAMEGWQNSGITLVTATENTVFTILFRGLDVAQEAAMQPVVMPLGWRPY